jgi:hypothetical protein
MCPANSSARRPWERELARSLRSWSVDDLSRRFVVGASAAGVAAAESARRAGFDGSITIIGDESHPLYPPRPIEGIALRERGMRSRCIFRLQKTASNSLQAASLSGWTPTGNAIRVRIWFSDVGAFALSLQRPPLRAHGSPPNAGVRHDGTSSDFLPSSGGAGRRRTSLTSNAMRAMLICPTDAMNPTHRSNR